MSNNEMVSVLRADIQARKVRKHKEDCSSHKIGTCDCGAANGFLPLPVEPGDGFEAEENMILLGPWDSPRVARVKQTKMPNVSEDWPEGFPEIHLENSEFDGLNADGTPPFRFSIGPDGVSKLEAIRLVGWKCIGPIEGLGGKPMAADPGEVEQLRATLTQWKDSLKYWMKRTADLNQQMAERDALLEGWHTANCTGEVNVSDKAYRIVTRTAAMLNTNTEPSVPFDRDARSDIVADAAYRNGVMHGYKLAMEGDEADYQVCINNLTEHLRAARAALSAIAEPSAPVERDERADFEKVFPYLDLTRIVEGDHHPQDQIGMYVDWRTLSMYRAWEARAALERKPSVLVAQLQADLTARDERIDQLEQALRSSPCIGAGAQVLAFMESRGRS